MTTMIEQQEVPTSEDAPEVPQSQATPEEVEGEDKDKAKSSREAAKWRTKLRESQAQAQALQAKVEAYQRQEIERVVAGTLSTSSDVFLLHDGDLSDFLDEEGAVDEDAALAIASAIAASRPGLRKNAPVYDRDQGRSGGAAPKVSWADLLRT